MSVFRRNRASRQEQRLCTMEPKRNPRKRFGLSVVNVTGSRKERRQRWLLVIPFREVTLLPLPSARCLTTPPPPPPNFNNLTSYMTSCPARVPVFCASTRGTKYLKSNLSGFVRLALRPFLGGTRPGSTISSAGKGLTGTIQPKRTLSSFLPRPYPSTKKQFCFCFQTKQSLLCLQGHNYKQRTLLRSVHRRK